jgi:hypothetical protein
MTYLHIITLYSHRLILLFLLLATFKQTIDIHIPFVVYILHITLLSLLLRREAEECASREKELPLLTTVDNTLLKQTRTTEESTSRNRNQRARQQASRLHH